MSHSQTPSISPESATPKPPRRWLVWVFRVIVAVMVLLAALVTYLIPMLMDKPDVSVDYLAKFNEPLAAVPEEDRAWPLYRDALSRSMYHKSQGYYDGLESDDKGKSIRPGHPEWARVVATLEQYAVFIQDVRDAAKKPSLGAPVVTRESPEDQEVLLVSYETPSEDDSSRVGRLKQNMLTNASFNKRVFLRRMARMLTADLRRAFELGDFDRAMADIEAQYGFARQSHAYDNPLGQLLTTSFTWFAQASVNEAMVNHAHQLSDEHLQRLAELLGNPLKRSNRFEDGEYLETLDIFQRLYGRSGKVSHDGLLFWYESFGEVPREVKGRMNEAFFIHGGGLIYLQSIRKNTATYPEMKLLLEQIQKDSKAFAEQPYWVQLKDKHPVLVTRDRLSRTYEDQLRYWPLLIWMSTSTSVTRSYQEMLATSQALRVGVILERFRRANNSYPQTLNELVPDYLDALPVDHSTGLPLLYKLVEGKPLLYGRGLDGDDDGGVVADPDDIHSRMVPQQGDWILYPRPVVD